MNYVVTQNENGMKEGTGSKMNAAIKKTSSSEAALTDNAKCALCDGYGNVPFKHSLICEDCIDYVKSNCDI